LPWPGTETVAAFSGPAQCPADAVSIHAKLFSIERVNCQSSGQQWDFFENAEDGNSLYVRQKKTGNKEVKIFADILFLWTVNGVCLVSCLLNPKADLRPSFISKFSGNSPTRVLTWDEKCRLAVERLGRAGIFQHLSQQPSGG
jgi:hypothetical protein